MRGQNYTLTVDHSPSCGLWFWTTTLEETFELPSIEIGKGIESSKDAALNRARACADIHYYPATETHTLIYNPATPEEIK